MRDNNEWDKGTMSWETMLGELKNSAVRNNDAAWVKRANSAMRNNPWEIKESVSWETKLGELKGHCRALSQHHSCSQLCPFNCSNISAGVKMQQEKLRLLERQVLLFNMLLTLYGHKAQST